MIERRLYKTVPLNNEFCHICIAWRLPGAVVVSNESRLAGFEGSEHLYRGLKIIALQSCGREKCCLPGPLLGWRIERFGDID